MDEIIGRGGVTDIHAIKISTKDGWHIPNERRMELPPETLKAAKRINMSIGDGVKPRVVSGTYNCVGMVFACRRTHIDSDWLPEILNRDGYSLIEETDVVIADLVVYFLNSRPKHVGIVVDVCRIGETTAIHVLSQWGASGEYFHPAQNVPIIFGCPTYWTERKTNEGVV